MALEIHLDSNEVKEPSGLSQEMAARSREGYMLRIIRCWRRIAVEREVLRVAEGVPGAREDAAH